MSQPSGEPVAGPAAPRDAGLLIFRGYASLTFAFAWIPVMFTAWTVDRGFTPTEYARFWSAYYLAMTLAEIPWGWVADRFGQRPLLVLGPLWLAACFVVLGHSTSSLACLLAMAATGAGHAMISGADSAWLYERLRHLGRARDALHEESLAHRWRLFGVSLADVAGGCVAWGFGTSAAFDLSVVIMLAASLLALRLPVVPRAADEHHRPSLSGLGQACRMPGVAWVLAWYAAVFVLLRIGFQLYQPTLIRLGATNLALHGGVLGFLNLTAGVAAVFVLRVFRRLGERRTATGVLLLLGLSFLGLAQVSAPSSAAAEVDVGLTWWPLLLAGALLFSLQQVAFGFLQPLGRTALNHRIPSTNRAGMLSAQSMTARLTFSALLFLGTWDTALTTGLSATYGELAMVVAVLAVLLHLGHRRSHRATALVDLARASPGS